ncbi:MAG TPA: hypothetical protein VEQ37_05965 [Actinomycetota bacterium]|nr:hypothetical protein [Actinomycetota bacterium]
MDPVETGQAGRATITAKASSVLGYYRSDDPVGGDTPDSVRPERLCIRSHTAVITVLTNRVYIGEVLFRSRYHRAPPLVDGDLFEAAHHVLEGRSGDHSLRRANGSGYLLTGLVVSERCDRRFVGAAANGKRYRYP